MIQYTPMKALIILITLALLFTAAAIPIHALSFQQRAEIRVREYGSNSNRTIETDTKYVNFRNERYMVISTGLYGIAVGLFLTGVFCIKVVYPEKEDPKIPQNPTDLPG